MSTLGQMNPTESLRPISRCFCKLVSGEKRCFAPMHPVTYKLKLCTVTFGVFLFSWNPYYASKWLGMSSMKWLLECAKDEFACCLYRTTLKPDGHFLACLYSSMRWFLRVVPFTDKQVQAGLTHIFPMLQILLATCNMKAMNPLPTLGPGSSVS